jgi:chaperone required for assembly of F1-ATPase
MRRLGQDVTDALLKYFDTDAMTGVRDILSLSPDVYSAITKTDLNPLVKLQEEHWSNLIQWPKEELRMGSDTFDSVLIASQLSYCRKKR